MNPLLSKLQTLDGQRVALLAKVDTTDAAGLPALSAELDQVDAAIAATNNIIAKSGETTRRVEVHDNRADKPWASFGEQLQAVVRAAQPGGGIDPRLVDVRAAASGASALVGTDGGFLVSEDVASEIFKKVYETGQLASRCSVTPISANSDSLEVPYVDETSRATGSRWGGVRVYRANETDAATATKVKYGKWECRLEDLKGLSYMTNRLLEDAAALESVMRESMTNEFAFTLDDEILNGDGIGKCLGVLKSGALVTVSKEAGPQTADTIVLANVVKMYSRMWGRSKQNAVWLINTDVLPQLFQLNVSVGNNAFPVFMPPGGVSGSPYSTLYGRPIIEIEQAATIGDLGDINFVDLSQYKLIRKGGLKSDVSMHVRFIYDEMCFKFGMRVNGQPMWKAPLTPYKGANTLSPFVTLEAR